MPEDDSMKDGWCARRLGEARIQELRAANKPGARPQYCPFTFTAPEVLG